MKDVILIVDDNPAALRQAAALLDRDYRVVMARSGVQAAAVAARAAPSLVLLDVDMPEMDGFATLAALKREPALEHVPAVFLTGNHDTATQVRALAAGGVDFIAKPFDRRILLHRIRLHIQMYRYQANLEKAVRDLEDGIIASFAEIAESRELGSCGHVHRVRGHMELFARAVWEDGLYPDTLDARYIDTLTRASVLHDVGKIGIDDTVLFKPGKLTPEEFAVVKTHADIGARTLERINSHTPTPVLDMAAEVARGHHERYDGSGYPRGLAGDAIPLSCRLMAVVNVYDALRSRTVYREAMDHDTACGIIRDGAGTEFEPCLVDAFLRRHRAFEAVREES